MPSLISEIVKEALVNQLGMEKYNASVYMYVAAFLKSKGFDNLGKLFEQQHDEEEGHAKLIYSLLTDLNEDFDMPVIDGCNMPILSMMDVGQLFLDREIETTNSLKEIMIQASEQGEGGCPVVQVSMLDMLRKQQSELAEATTFNDKCQIIGSDWKTALLWDATMEG